MSPTPTLLAAMASVLVLLVTIYVIAVVVEPARRTR